MAVWHSDSGLCGSEPVVVPCAGAGPQRYRSHKDSRRRVLQSWSAGALGSGGNLALEVPGVEDRPSCRGRISNPTFQGLTLLRDAVTRQPGMVGRGCDLAT